MIEKDKNTHRINRLRVIKVYEVYYNLILKYFWPHKKYSLQNETTYWVTINEEGYRYVMQTM